MILLLLSSLILGANTYCLQIIGVMMCTYLLINISRGNLDEPDISQPDPSLPPSSDPLPPSSDPLPPSSDPPLPPVTPDDTEGTGDISSKSLIPLQVISDKATTSKFIWKRETSKLADINLLMDSNFYSCAINNTYVGFSKNQRLPTTDKDTNRIKKLINRKTKQISCIRNLSANDMKINIEKTLKVAESNSCPAFVFVSGHGTGGKGTIEYLVGDDGKFLSENVFRALLVNLKVPYVIFVIDACHSGGMLNLQYTFEYTPSGKVNKICECDDGETKTEDQSSYPPILAMAASKEVQYAQAATDGSVFTTELVKSIGQKSTLDSIMKTTARNCKKRLDKFNIGNMTPLIAFNEQFLKMVKTSTSQKAIRVPQDVLVVTTMF